MTFPDLAANGAPSGTAYNLAFARLHNRSKRFSVMFSMWPKRWLLLPIFLGLFLFLGWKPAAGQNPDHPAIEMSAQAGFDNYYKAEYWLPVQVTVANNGPAVNGRLEIEVTRGAGNDKITYSSPIDLPNQSNKRQTLYVQLTGFSDELTVKLLDETGQTLEVAQSDPLNRLALDGLLYAVVSSDPGAFSHLDQVSGGRSTTALALIALDQLPDSGPAWNALDLILIHDVDTARLTPAQFQALKAWLDAGGQLVVTGGPNWQKSTAGLADLLPVTITDTANYPDLPGLEAWAATPFRDPGPYLVTRSELKTGETLLAEADQTLLARRTHGRGNIFFLALDPALAPLKDWDGGLVIWSAIADHVPPVLPWAAGPTNGYAAGTAVSSLPNLALPSGWQLFAYLFIYVLFIGPLNYLFLARRGRRELAWLTIPVLTAVFTLIAYFAGFGLKGNNTIINQMSVVFGPADGDMARAHTLIGIYSPRRATHDLVLVDQAQIRPFGQSFGPLSGGGDQASIDQADPVTVRGIRLDVSEVATFIADSYQPGPAIKAEAILRTSAGKPVLELTIQNNGSFTLENLNLLLANSIVPLADLEPGQTISYSEPLSPAGFSSSAAGSVAGSIAIGAPVRYGNSPFSPYYGELLGTFEYYNDPAAYARWQLLESLASEFLPLSDEATFTRPALVGWSDSAQVELSLVDQPFSPSATTLYILEVPFVQDTPGEQNLVISEALLNRQVIDQNGVYSADTRDFYLSPGWIDLDYQPWPVLEGFEVEELALVLESGFSETPPPLPLVWLWDWQAQEWVKLTGLTWGRSQVVENAAFLDSGNRVRIRLQNDGPAGIDIQAVYPELVGNLASTRGLE